MSPGKTTSLQKRTQVISSSASDAKPNSNTSTVSLSHTLNHTSQQEEEELHPLFSTSVPSDLKTAHSGYMALAHLSSSSDDDDVMKVGPIRRTNRRKRKRSTPYEKDMKEFTFVFSNKNLLK